MPVHTAVGSDAAALATLVAKVEETGEKIVTVIPAGNVWAVVTEIKPKVGRPKAQTR